MEAPKNDPQYYIAKTRGLLKGFHFLDPLGGLGLGFRVPTTSHVVPVLGLSWCSAKGSWHKAY